MGRLRINNFAKIRHADIQFNGITVIAGKNNTGKSTIGKVLYSLFNSFYNLDAKIESRRGTEIYEICYSLVRNIVLHSYNNGRYTENSVRFRLLGSKISAELRDSILEKELKNFSREVFEQLIVDTVHKFDIVLEEKIKLPEAEIESAYEKIVARKVEDDYKIALELIQRYFAGVFNDQMKCLRGGENVSDISLTIKDQDLILRFCDNECSEWQSEYSILHEAFFIDDPFILDDLSSIYLDYDTMRTTKRQLIRCFENPGNDRLDGVFDAINAKENLKEIYRILGKVTEGKITRQNGSWSLDTEQFTEPLYFENLSAGLKSFVLIKILLERGILKEKDILILDEPEIHLHPEWQLLYAEIIVLLEKKFDLSIIVTTHSRDFLEAIELYAKKYGLEHRCNYYLSQLKDGLAEFEEVSGHMEKIYEQLVTPSMLLDKIRYELEEEENE